MNAAVVHGQFMFLFREIFPACGSRTECAFHVIRPPVPAASGQKFQTHSDTGSTVIRPGQSEQSDAGLYCYSPGVVAVKFLPRCLRVDSPLRVIR